MQCMYPRHSLQCRPSAPLCCCGGPVTTSFHRCRSAGLGMFCSSIYIRTASVTSSSAWRNCMSARPQHLVSGQVLCVARWHHPAWLPSAQLRWRTSRWRTSACGFCQSTLAAYNASTASATECLQLLLPCRYGLQGFGPLHGRAPDWNARHCSMPHVHLWMRRQRAPQTRYSHTRPPQILNRSLLLLGHGSAFTTCVRGCCRGRHSRCLLGTGYRAQAPGGCQPPVGGLRGLRPRCTRRVWSCVWMLGPQVLRPIPLRRWRLAHLNVCLDVRGKICCSASGS